MSNGDLFKINALDNAIKRLWFNPCSATPELYIETFLPAFTRAVIDFYSPDPKEIYHLVRGNSLVCDIKKVIKASAILPPEDESLATRFVFRGMEIFDLAIWKIFILGVLEDFLIDWSSGVTTWSCASNPDDWGTGPVFEWHGNTGGAYYPGVFHIDSPTSQFYPLHSTVLSAGFGKPWAMTAQGRWAYIGSTATPAVNIRIRDSDTDEVFDADAGNPLSPGSNFRSVFYGGTSAHGRAQNLIMEAKDENPTLLVFYMTEGTAQFYVKT